MQLSHGRQDRSLFSSENSCIVLEPLHQRRHLGLHLTDGAASLADLERDELAEFLAQQLGSFVQNIRPSMPRSLGPDARLEDFVGVVDGIVNIFRRRRMASADKQLVINGMRRRTQSIKRALLCKILASGRILNGNAAL